MSSSSESESSRILRLSEGRPEPNDALLFGAVPAGVLAIADPFGGESAFATDRRILSRRSLSLSESLSDAATKRRRLLLRPPAVDGVAALLDAAARTGAGDGCRDPGLEPALSCGDGARAVDWEGDGARKLGDGLGARTGPREGRRGGGALPSSSTLSSRRPRCGTPLGGLAVATADGATSWCSLGGAATP